METTISGDCLWKMGLFCCRELLLCKGWWTMSLDTHPSMTESWACILSNSLITECPNVFSSFGHYGTDLPPTNKSLFWGFVLAKSKSTTFEWWPVGQSSLFDHGHAGVISTGSYNYTMSLMNPNTQSLLNLVSLWVRDLTSGVHHIQKHRTYVLFEMQLTQASPNLFRWPGS